MSRNLVVCRDGTGGQLCAKGHTDVVLPYELLDRSDPTQQVAGYGPGVGTFASGGAAATTQLHRRGWEWQ